MLINLFSLATRPSRPRMCRKRRLCQGQARSGRYASLDIRRLASGHRCMRAMDVNAAGRGSEHEQPNFPDALFPLASGGPDVCPASIISLPLLRMRLSGSTAFAFLQRAFFFPRACLFVRRHLGRPAYVTCTRAAALYPLRLARGFAPLTPTRPAKGSGLAKGKRRKRP